MLEVDNITKSDMRKFFYTFLTIFLVGWILFALFTLFIGFPLYSIFNFIWFLLGIIGIFGIIIYIVIPSKLRTFLKKRKKHEELKILSTAGPIISLIGGIITFALGYYYYETNFWGMGRQSIGIPLLIIGAISTIGVAVIIKSKEVGNIINIIVGIPGLIYLQVVLGLPIVFILIGGLLGFLSAKKNARNREGNKKNEPP